MGGEFDGAGEAAEIVRRNDHWVLRAQSVCEKHKALSGDCKEWKKIEANARCYEYDQQNP